MCGIYICAQKRISDLSFPLLISGFFFGSIIAIAYARGGMGAFNGMGTEVVLSSQYSMMPTWFLIGVFLILCEISFEIAPNFIPKISSGILVSIIYVLMLSLSISKMYIVRDYATLHQATASIVQNYDQVIEDIRLQYVYPEDISSDVDWIKENRLFLFNSDKVYQYPYSGLYLYSCAVNDPVAELSETLRSGSFWIDYVNNSPQQSYTIVENTSDLKISGWALDDTTQSAPRAVYLEIAGQYYQLNQTNRPDVSQVYWNNSNGDSLGFEGWISLKDFSDGSYPVTLVVINNDGTSYYQSQITTVVVGDRTVDDPTIGLNEVSQDGAFCIDYINDSPWQGEIITDTTSRLHIVGWALDSTVQSTPQAVYLEFDGQYYPLALTERNDVSEVYFGNVDNSLCGFDCWISLEEYTPDDYTVSLIVICEDGTTYYSAPIADVAVSAP
jgi:hypothetical protein